MGARDHSADLCRLLSGQRPDEMALTPVSWPDLVAAARHEGVVHLLYRQLNATGWPPSAPHGLREELRDGYLASAAANLLVFRELARILAAFEDGSVDPPIPAIVLKGPALAATVYPTPGLRPFSDLDLLVPGSRSHEAIAALRHLGFSETGAPPQMLPGISRWLSQHAPAMAGGEWIALSVEIHRSLLGSEHDRRAPEIEWFWQQSETADLGPARARVLAPTAHLLYLAAHLALQHGVLQGGLIRYYDLDLLVRRCGDRLDWDEIVRRACQFRWAPAVDAALTGARERFGTPIPTEAITALRTATDAETAALVDRRAPPDPARASLALAGIAGLSWPARLRYLQALILPAPDYVRWRYRPRPAWLWPLCYPYRWLDMARDGILAVLRR